MDEPIADLVDLLEPLASFTKYVTSAGGWSLTRTEIGRPFFCACMEGDFVLAVDGCEPLRFGAGDVVLIPMARQFEMCSPDRAPGDRRRCIPVHMGGGEFRLGEQGGIAEGRMIIGYGEFQTDNSGVLAQLLPPLVHVRGDDRLTTLVGLIDDEARTHRAARTGVMTRLLAILMIEALRSSRTDAELPSLLRGLANRNVGDALRAIHAAPEQPWTVSALAKVARMSRSAFFARFKQTVGEAPMTYLLHWRMHLAKRMLPSLTVSQVALAVGYASTSAFSTAFTRSVGNSPSTWLRNVRLATA